MPRTFFLSGTKDKEEVFFFFAVCVIVTEITGGEGWPVKGQSLHTA